MKKFCPILALVVYTVAANQLYASQYGSSSELIPFSPSYVPTEQTSTAIESATSRASSVSTDLGTDMSKDVTPAAKLQDNTWFSSPAVYTEAFWTGSNDKRPNGVNSDRYGSLLGFDFLTVENIVVGLLYGYSNDSGKINEVNTDLNTDNHSITLYTAKNFNDWFNVGGTFTYTNSDSEIDVAGIAGNQGSESEVLTPSIYFGVAHTWNALSASSTVSYLYSDDEVDSKVPGTAGFSQSTGSLLWLNKVSYNICESFSVAGLFNMTQILHTNTTDNNPPLVGESNDHNWGTVGAEFSYYPSQNWEVTTGARYDIFNENYEETVTVSLGATYSF